MQTKIEDHRRRLATGAILLGLLVTVVGAGAAGSPALAAPSVAVPAERYVIDGSTSQVLYHVGETFIDQNNRFFTAVGTTRGIQGEILIDRGHPARVGSVPSR